jgi:alkylation response protein AidB-like acyl-CoA dehydrogenase
MMAPDEGNMHLLLEAATPRQRDLWLRPLAEGRIRSCFLMTEPDVASSDPLSLRTTAERIGDELVIHGRKSFATGATGAKVAFVVVRTGREVRPESYSIVGVPTDTSGFTVTRNPELIGAHYPGGHGDVTLDEVRVPAENVLGEVGEGYRLAQIRLVVGRLGHAMRWVGISQRALDLMTDRMATREVGGRPLSEQQFMQQFLADSAIEVYAARLMVLRTARDADEGREVQQQISMLKTFVSEAYGRIVDRALQVFGGAGMTRDHPFAQWYADARAARIYDGPSEVHRIAIAKRLIRARRNGESTRAACGGVE